MAISGSAQRRCVRKVSRLAIAVCAGLSLVLAVLVCIVTLAGGVGRDDDDATKSEVECPAAPPPRGPVYPAPSLKELGVPCEEDFTATGTSCSS